MGASVSRTKVEIVNESITDIIVKAAQEADSHLEATQQTVLSGVNIGFYQKQDVSVSVQALQSVVIDNTILEEIAQKIRTEAKAEGQLLNPAYADSDTNIKNLMKTKLTNETLQKCVSSTIAKQQTIASGINIGAVVIQDAHAISECQQMSTIANDISKEIFQDVDTKSHAESKGLFDFLFGDWGGIYITAFIVLIIMVIIIAVVLKMGGGKKGRRRRPPPRQQRQPESYDDGYDDVYDDGYNEPLGEPEYMQERGRSREDRGRSRSPGRSRSRGRRR